MKDQRLYDAVMETAQFAEEKLGADSTPAFFLKRMKVSGAESIEECDEIIVPVPDL